MTIALLMAALLTGITLSEAEFAAAGVRKCPIEDVVAVIREVKGDGAAARIVHNRITRPAITNECVLYGDRLEVGPGAVVEIETSKGLRHVGGAYDSAFEAPAAAHEEIAERASAFLAALFEGLFSRSRQTVYATSRGSQSCAAPTDQAVEPLAPLDRLRHTDQEIGSDIQVIVAAWEYSENTDVVRASLRDRSGITIVSATTCRSSHLELRLTSSKLSPGDRLTLEIDNGDGVPLNYDLVVVEPSTLPLPQVYLPNQWLIAMWRLSVGAPEVQLDSISRLQTAPVDILAAKTISDLIWSDLKF